MRTKTFPVIGLLLGIAALAGCTRSQEPARNTPPAGAATAAGAAKQESAVRPNEGKAALALRRAASANKHLFIFFYGVDDEPTRLARKSFETAMRGLSRDAEWMGVDITKDEDAEIVNRFRVRYTSMPLVLAIAPNGAVTSGFRAVDCGDEEKLRGAIASRGLQECLKALQERKLVFICIQGKKTKFNREAMRGVDDFKADPRYAAYTTVVTIDPSDKAEKGFLGSLKIDAKATEAATALLVPPSYLLGVTNGATTKDSFLKLLASASSGGCGPKGCGPTGCGPVKK